MSGSGPPFGFKTPLGTLTKILDPPQHRQGIQGLAGAVNPNFKIDWSDNPTNVTSIYLWFARSFFCSGEANLGLSRGCDTCKPTNITSIHLPLVCWFFLGRHDICWKATLGPGPGDAVELEWISNHDFCSTEISILWVMLFIVVQEKYLTNPHWTRGANTSKWNLLLQIGSVHAGCKQHQRNCPHICVLTS